MLAAGVDLQFVEHHPAEAGLGQHPPHGLLDDEFGLAVTPMLGRLGLETLIAGIPAIQLLLPLLAGELHLVGVDHDHVVAGIDVRGVGGTVLAHQHHGDLAGQPTDPAAARVDDPPPLLDLAGLRHERLHRADQPLFGVGPGRRRGCRGRRRHGKRRAPEATNRPVAGQAAAFRAGQTGRRRRVAAPEDRKHTAVSRPAAMRRRPWFPARGLPG